MRYRLSLAAVLAALWAAPAAADWTEAACEIYPAGSDRIETMLPCTFAQSQGAITITRGDGVTHELTPSGETPGNFHDQDGRTVYRQSGLGDQGLIFRFPDISIFLYWDSSALHPDETDNPTAPFSTADYDATTLLACRAATATDFGQCPAGILRMENGQASIEVESPRGERFTMNFLKDATDGTPYVNATNRAVDARYESDTWTVTIDGHEVYEVPLAVIEGG
ncbi:MAG TPA: hypothetical protein PKA33_09305 [Amaricoccus sp.]|uniref:hypothetical protein n=1 Tax=Amaricoccus sp. TaxID=1872485 RepID=UPI002BBC5EE2|nr:hypothetical protein [Amaricoccus sp.]HMQ91704.1 hypothetical protein [Amaricoccus sp.]HMR52584.1 hypothetical protein [Amaricoccus sp.]HMR60498.1 hypothetical protein [Amaricoccus sp.]HMT99546.1 hypothetical protein [Amaricoccus sp.]